jgi:hypothetical protein
MAFPDSFEPSVGTRMCLYIAISFFAGSPDFVHLRQPYSSTGKAD